MARHYKIILLSLICFILLSACSAKPDTGTEAAPVPMENTGSDRKPPEESASDIPQTSPSEMRESGQSTPEHYAAVAEEQTASVNNENNDTEWRDDLEVDFTHDYSEKIQAEIDQVVSSSTSLQNELENVETMIQKYKLLAEKAQTQSEMNLSSQWFYTIWDTELNNLWSRLSNSADQQTKEKILADQRKWISMKEGAVYELIGSSEENGSLYPMLVNACLESITRNRAYVLANELAKVKEESFAMPEKKYGLYVDNQGTGDIYSSLVIRQGEAGDDEAVFSLFRMGEIRGTVVDNGKGELSFTSNDSGTRAIKGILKINGWDGASFTITEAPDGAYTWYIGKTMDFPFAF